MPRLEGKGTNSGANLLVALVVLLLVLAILYFAYLKPQGILDLGF
jgi:preprotein translocase subunit YajC